MDVIGVMDKVLQEARKTGQRSRVEEDVKRLAFAVGLTQDDLDAVEDYAYKYGTDAVAYYP